MSSIFKKILKTFSNIKEKTIIKLNKFTKKVNFKFSPKTFFKNSFTVEKFKIVSIATAFILAFAITMTFGSFSKMAVYVKGEKIGYAEDENAAISMVEQYNNFADTNHGTSSDIILQNEFTMERNLLSGNMVQEAISDVIDEEFTDAYLLYIDDVFVLASDDVDKIRENISKIEKDVSKALKYEALMYNDVKIENSFYPSEKITTSSNIYTAICGIDSISKENIAHATLLDDDNNPKKMYSVNGLYFEAYEFYEKEIKLKSETVYKKDNTVYEGTDKVTTKGQDGLVVETYRRVVFEGEVQSNELIDTTTKKKKIDKVITQGTKKIVWSENPKVLTFPLSTSNYVFTSEFGWRDLYGNGNTSFHSGLDIAVPTGSSVLACSSGKVTVATYNGGDAGVYIEIKHDNGLTSKYMHLSELLVSVGDTVKAGETIGLSGNTGQSTGPHLHFTILDPNGSAVNPRNYLKMP